MIILRRLLTVSCGLLAWLVATGVARAEWNATPIAVPLIGTSGTASPYPSTIDVAPTGGPFARGPIGIKLHAVTHPCPKDLLILLVHANTEKYLLMSNAGGCRPMAGTDLWFEGGWLPLPSDDPTPAPYGDRIRLDISAYWDVDQPVLPAPAPAGPYLTHLPFASVPIAGRWDLYVMDQRDNNRGVIGGGWSLEYRQVVDVPATTAMPVNIPAIGAAASYPITFDLSNMTVDAVVRRMALRLFLSHPFADDVRVVLQSPSGAAVVVMANAGGSSALSASQELIFDDDNDAHMPDAGPMPSGSQLAFKPGSAYDGTENVSLPAPAPAAPYGTAFSAFIGQPARGVWKLWVYDDEFPQGGQVINAGIIIKTDIGPPTLSLIAPSTTNSFTSTQPFVQFVGLVGNVDRPFTVFWRNDANGAFYDAAPMTIVPNTLGPQTASVLGTVSLKQGTNVVRVRIISNSEDVTDASITVAVNEFTYTLTEGATGGFFDEDVTLGNAADAGAPVRIDFLQEGASPVTHTDNVAANAPLQLHVDDLVPPGAVSTIVHSTNAVPLAVERTMSWDSSGYGGSGGTAIAPSTLWLFAEGSQGYFDTYLLLANDNDADAATIVRFLLEGGGVVSRTVTVPAHKRVTIYAGDIGELVNRSFGMEVSAPLATPIAAERAMYFPHNGVRLWEGGHEAAGVNSTSTRWYLAEGATGPFFECFVLLSNPNASVAHATLTYLLPGGATVTQTTTVPANGRTTINVETVDTRLANTAVSTIVSADVGIIVERSMYWPDISIGWSEAHNSPGVVDPALRWGVSDVRVGGPRAHQTYILLANPNPVPAEVQVRLLRTGAAPITQSYTLAPTSRTNVVAADLAGNVTGTYSAEVQVVNYQPIVVEKALYWDAGGRVWAAGTGVVATPIPPR